MGQKAMPEYVGKVTKKPFGKGSKSESEAIFLETGDGEFVLRRQGGNPFHDPELQKLVGKTIRCTGLARDYVLKISDWTELA
jgi:hypothetical protein